MLFGPITEGIERLKEAKTIIFTQNSYLRSQKKKDPKSVQGIKAFAAENKVFWSMMLTKNSPLLPMFRHAATQSMQSGQISRLTSIWVGDKVIIFMICIKSKPSSYIKYIEAFISILIRNP